MIKNLWKYTLAFLLTGAVLGSLLFMLNLPARATSIVRYVAPGSDCGGASPCYATIQAAVDAAATSDSIKIAEGIYTTIPGYAPVTQYKHWKQPPG